REQLGAKPVHHRHDDDEGRHTKHDAEKGDAGDDRDHRLLAPGAQITPGDKTFEMGEGRGSSVTPRGVGHWRTRTLNRFATASMARVSLSPVARFFTSTSPAATPRGPTITCQGRPMRSAVANLAPGR